MERYRVKGGDVLKHGRVLEHVYVPLGVIQEREGLLDLYGSEINERI